jgi:hypothetical protein
VPFHFVPARWTFLERVLRGLSSLDVESVRVVVDSNTGDVADLARGLSLPGPCTVTVQVHPALAHPYDLTWAHRRNMGDSLDAFDYFLYVEDDILVPPETFAAWRRRADAVDRAGFVHGFLRVEQDAAGRAVASDWRRPLRDPAGLRIDGTTYVRPEAFYQACWAYSRHTMRRFVRTRAWTRGFHRWSSVTRAHRRLQGGNYVREFSAFGMSCARPGRARTLLPLGEDGQVARDAWVWHLPNNYADRQDVRLLSAGELVLGEPRRPSPVADTLLEGARWASHLLYLGDAARAARAWARRRRR